MAATSCSTRGRGARLRRIRITSTERTAELPTDLMSLPELLEGGGGPPTLLQAPQPPFLSEIMKQSATGTVGLEAVVLADGSVGPVKVTDSLDPDLDLAAVAAVCEWRFTPATFKGKAVAVSVTVELTFRFRMR